MLLDIPNSIETNRLILRRYEPGDGSMYFTVGQKNRQHLQQFEDVDHQGKVYVTEAVKAALGFIFKYLKAQRICLHTRDSNLLSQRVTERCGFILEGHIRENKRDPDGTISGDSYYGLLKREYNASS